MLRGVDALYDSPTPYIAAWHQAPVGVRRDEIRLMLQLTSPRRGAGKLKFPAGSEAAVGAVHGGVSSTGLELVGAAALHRAAGAAFHTASLRVNFLRPFHGGGEAHYGARALHAGRGSGVAEAAAGGADGRA